MFKIGQEVICVLKADYIKVGSTYTIRDLNTHKCGTVVDIGLNWDKSIAHYSSCEYCNNNHRMWGSAKWYDDFHFATLEQWEAAEETKESLLEELKVKI